MRISICHTDMLVTKSVLLFALFGNLGTFQQEMRRIAKRFLRYMRGPFSHICISGFPKTSKEGVANSVHAFSFL